MTIEDYCHSPVSNLLKPFISEILAINYNDKPDYGKLQFTLVNILLSRNILPKMNLLDIENP